jgi:hypothetical protein
MIKYFNPLLHINIFQMDLRPFLFIKINSYLLYILRGFLRPEKNAGICTQRAMLFIQLGVTALCR